MIFDSLEQKNYIIRCVSSCREWSHQESLQLSSKFDLGIQNAEIIPIEEQPKKKLADPEPTAGMEPPSPVYQQAKGAGSGQGAEANGDKNIKDQTAKV